MEKEQSWRNFNLPGETYLNLDTFSSSSPNTDSPPDLLYSFLEPLVDGPDQSGKERPEKNSLEGGASK
jgi:hypothetical protein